MEMSIDQNNSERFVEMNYLLKKSLEDFEGTMTVRFDDGRRCRVTLLQIYNEWMNYLKIKREKEKNKDTHLLDGWEDFVVRHGVSLAAKVLVEFFKKKRDYMAVQENGLNGGNYRSGEDICIKLKLYQDIDLINKLFPSYSAAEVRMRKHFERAHLSEKLLDGLGNVLSMVRTKESLNKENDKGNVAFDKVEFGGVPEGKKVSGVQLQIKFSDGSEDENPKEIKSKIFNGTSENSQDKNLEGGQVVGASKLDWKNLDPNQDDLYAYDPNEPYWNR